MEVIVSTCLNLSKMNHLFVLVALIQEKDCRRFRWEIMAVEEAMQAELCPDNIVDIMLRNEKSWTTLTPAIVSLQHQLPNAKSARVRSA